METLLRASGAGAIANKTIGASAAGGMLLGTLVGLLVIPGLYFIFATLADRRKLLPDERNMPLSESKDQGGEAGSKAVEL